MDCILQTCQISRQFAGPRFASPVFWAMRNAVVSSFEIPFNVLRFVTGRLPGSPGIHGNIREFYDALAKGAPPPVLPEEGLRLVSALASACDEADRQRDAIRVAQLAPRPDADFLVTGASGFLGSALLRRLAEQSARVRAGAACLSNPFLASTTLPATLAIRTMRML